MTNNTIYRYLGYGTTDNTGTAKLDHDPEGNVLEHSYEGLGIGKVDVIASLDNPMTESSIVSDIKSFIDATFYDEATTGHKNTNWTADRVTVSETDDNGTLLYSENGNGHYWANGSSQSISGAFACEFDLISYSDTRSVAFRVKAGNDNNHYFIFKDSSLSPNVHVKFVYDGTTFKYQINDGSLLTWITATYSSVELAFRLSGANDSLKYRNFVIYPI